VNPIMRRRVTLAQKLLPPNPNSILCRDGILDSAFFYS
jgi:hypothetical protein